MSEPKENGKEPLPYEKKFAIAAIALAGMGMLAMLFSILQGYDVIPAAFDLFIIVRFLMALAMGCETLVYWRKRRGYAILYICMAVLWLFGGILDLIK